MYKKINNWQKFLLLLGGIIGATTVFAAPVSNIFRNLLPETNLTYEIGTSTARWFNIYTRLASTSAISIVNTMYIGGTASTTGTATTTIMGANATSTFSGGIRLSQGCFELANGTCAGTTYLAGTGLTLTGTTFSVNTSQNISTLSNLTSNGFVKTSGGTGALSIDTATYLTAAITSLNSLTGATQTFSASNVALTSGQYATLTISSAGTVHTFFTEATSSPTYGFVNATSSLATSTFASFLSQNSIKAGFINATSSFISGEAGAIISTSSIGSLNVGTLLATATIATSTINHGLSVGNSIKVSALEATSTIKIPTGIATAASTTGMFGIDTSDDQFFYNTGTTTPATSTIRVLSPWQEFSFSISSSTSFTSNDEDLEKLLLRRFKEDITIRQIYCITNAGTQVIALYQSTQTGGITNLATNGIDFVTTITCNSTGAQDDGELGNGTVPAGSWLGLSFGTAATKPQKLNVTVYYTKNRL